MICIRASFTMLLGIVLNLAAGKSLQQGTRQLSTHEGQNTAHLSHKHYPHHHHNLSAFTGRLALNDTDQLPKKLRQMSSKLQNIRQHDWEGMKEPFTFCVPSGSNFCANFPSSDPDQDHVIIIPTSGIYKISYHVAWQPFEAKDAINKLAIGGKSRVFKAQISRLKNEKKSTEEELAMDKVASDCNDKTDEGGIPCAWIHFNQQVMLDKGDKIYVSTNYKGLLIRDQSQSYLEITMVSANTFV